MDVINLLTLLVGSIGGLSGIVTIFVHFKQNKRIKNNEADKGYIDNLAYTINVMKEELQRCKKEIKELRDEVGELRHNNNYLQKMVNIYEHCATFLNKCKYSDDCPMAKEFHKLTK
ncbi:MAG: hypothetical protein PHR38_10050 [Bacteroidales bacterium]|jgi:predicted RNase H-like nuclease (RuvC/YqgF family)|nr:hypothetical protein [Bacteroidales bacterium]MDD3331487.1 hypothetical protein [Bacteroidales bacterium]